MKIYFAGPLMTAGEREFNKTVVTLLRAAGHEVFLPQEQEQRETSARNIFLGDVRGIDWADVVVANMDGADPDSGTCWECGYAYKKKPVILYRTDIREEAPPFGPYNLMLHQAADYLIYCMWFTAEEVAEELNITLELMPHEKTPR